MMKQKKNLLQKTLVTSFAIILVFSFAQIGNAIKFDNPLGPNGPDTIEKFITALLTGALQIGIPIVALAVIYSGFLFVQARGNSEKITKAKDAILYTLLGAAILLGALAIAHLIFDTVVALEV